MGMKFGCCIGRADQLPVVRNSELDYIEVSVAGLIMSGDADDFEHLRVAMRSEPRVLAANVFLPAGARLVGPDADGEAVLGYAREAVRRLRALGVGLLVLGSGAARRIPDGYPPERGLEELAGFCRRTAGIAEAAGITLVLEPLRRAESNVWNSVGEVAAFIRDHDLDRVRLLADLYHMREDGEPLAAVIESADLLAHTHVAGPGRVPPHPEADLTTFLAHVRRVQPELSCSIECRWNDFEAELSPALEALRAA